ncbi:MAG: XdhC family protein [Oscillospiraceae bacterium]|nr:XdhC family protein [Oscillospiraceae bacterium]
MSRTFQSILAQVRRGEEGVLRFTVEGEEYRRHFRPKERLLLLGAGHVAQPLCRYASDLGFAVTVADDRPDFANYQRFPESAEVICDAFPASIRRFGVREGDYVAVITRGHRWDADCLRVLLPGPLPRYLGMIGSKRRVAGLFELLAEEGYSKEAIGEVHSPIGVSINALTTKEIAISIVAELIACRRKDTPRHSGGTDLTTEEADLGLLEFLAEDESPKALLLVLEISGSTPVKSGAMMALNRLRQSAGTIGGGCGESAVMQDALGIIGSGEQKVVNVDMSNDVAEEEGMVCGGQMKVLICDSTLI